MSPLPIAIGHYLWTYWLNFVIVGLIAYFVGRSNYYDLTKAFLQLFVFGAFMLFGQWAYGPESLRLDWRGIAGEVIVMVCCAVIGERFGRRAFDRDFKEKWKK